MPVPRTRSELVQAVTSTYETLRQELERAGPRAGNLVCVEDWSIKDLLAVRAWWTEHVIDWVHAGQRGECPFTPAEGYRWKETPRLNADIISRSRRDSYRNVRSRLQAGFDRVIPTIDSLNDPQLLESGVYEWAGNYPISRWISINTVRQYVTARSYVRRALRAIR